MIISSPKNTKIHTQRQYLPLLISQMSQSGQNNAVIITAEDILGNLGVIIPSPSQPQSDMIITVEHSD